MNFVQRILTWEGARMPDPKKVYEIFSKAIQIYDVDERREFVTGATAGDEALFDEVWTLCQAEFQVRRNEDPVQIGETVGNYEITRPVHSGQLATVYSASHLLIKNPAAVKIFKEAVPSAKGEEFKRRDPIFRRDVAIVFKEGEFNDVVQ